MQKAYASTQLTQLIGRFSWLPTELVHVEYGAQDARLVFVGAILLSSDTTQPGS
jgi:hypothetical protein